MTGFPAAVQFLTRIPVRLRAAPDTARAVPWFPIVGALVGLVVGGVYAALHHVLIPAVAAGLAVVVGLAVTGAFHEDGLADVADAMGGWTPDERREILKDSRHGSYGVAALTGSILVRTLALASFGPAGGVAACVAAHGLGRSAAVTAMPIAGRVGEQGLGAEYVRAVRPATALAGAASGVAVAALAIGWWIAPALGAATVGTAVVLVVVRRSLGQLGGDALGAIEQVVEVLVLVVVSGLALRHALWWR